MSKKTHQRELERARAKRQASAYAKRQQRMRLISIVLILALAGAVVVAAALSGGDDDLTIDNDPFAFDSEQDTPGDTNDPGQGDPAAGTPCPPPDVAPPLSGKTYDAPPEMVIDTSKSYTATIVTTCGDIEVELFDDDAPLTVNNFVFLAQDDFYDGSPFHRIIPGFMIQGGDGASGDGFGNPGYTFADELDTVATYGMGRGVLAMANGGPDSNGSQFFIVQGVADHLTTHTVFGRVTTGMEVVDDIISGPAGGPRGDSALEPVIVLDVQISEA